MFHGQTNAQINHSPYWSSNATAAPQTGPLEQNVNVNTAIVGAGFTGLRAALALAEAGQKVAVLEAQQIAWGASGRTGGQVNPLPPVNSPQQIEKHVGAKYFQSVVQTMLGSADELFELITNYQIDCQARQKGWLRVDHCTRAMQAAHKLAQAWSEYGIKVDFLEGDHLYQETGSTVFQTGTLIHKGGAIHPKSYAHGLAQCAIDAGAEIYTNTPALGLTQKNTQWEVATPTNTVQAETVLLCTNGYTGKLIPGLAQSIIPLVSIQMASEPLEENKISTILPKGRTISDTRRTIIYGRREPDNRILLGSLGRLSDRGDAVAFRELEQEARRIYPILNDMHWEFHWSGKIAITRDHLPHIHEPRPGVFAGLGFNGRGVAMSNVMGRILAERVLGKSADQLPLPVSKIKTFPFHRFHRIGAKAAMWWMRRQDKREIKT